MWSIVVFKDDNSVEAVPSFWYKNKKCAWPRKNFKKFIERKTEPNNIEFDYLEARALGKNVESYTVARNRAKKSEITSDLSTVDDELSEGSVSGNLKHTNIKRKKVEKTAAATEAFLWSPASSDIISTSSNDFLLLNNPDKISWPSKKNVKKQLSFDEVCHSPNLECLTTLKNSEGSLSNIIVTTCSPFKVTCEEKETNHLDSSSQSQLLKMDKVLELFNNINRTVCNIKYEVMSLSDKLDNSIDRSGKNNSNIESTDEDMFQKDISMYIPLETEEDLAVIEKKLMDQEFRKKMTFELKSYARNTLPSTVRAVMRFLFKDKLLDKFSFKGQKKKKVFYTLAICSVIFDAIKLMKKYNKYDTIEVEQPLRVFISGAKFRNLPKTKTVTTGENILS